MDEYQRKVVYAKEQNILVVAGAGSGKSLTIIGKIVYLVKIKKIKPEDILCISFTNDATNNLEKNIKKNYEFNIKVLTFYKLSLNILKQNHVDFTIIPDNFLNDLIDYFFESIIPNNKKYRKNLIKILGKKYSQKQLNNLKRLILTFINLFKSNDYKIDYFKTILKKIKHNINLFENKKNKRILLIIINIYILYESELQKEKAIDFNDMINKSIQLLKENNTIPKYKYIIIDEYQDTSYTKFKMIQEIQRITKAKLLAVGDDFQSIYRFTGCNLNIFLKFKMYYENSQIYQIVNTYRNPQELIDVAGKFIMKNKYQQKKNLKSHKRLKNPIQIYYSNNKIKILKYLLNKLKDNEIMVLGRNNKDIDYYIDNQIKKITENIYEYNDIHFTYLTIHKSKGLESDNTIIINVIDSIIGIPTKMKEEKILKYVNDTKNYYPFEEERRLFYVALTRTKNSTYLITEKNKESVFIKELITYKNNIEIKQVNF